MCNTNIAPVNQTELGFSKRLRTGDWKSFNISRDLLLSLWPETGTATAVQVPAKDSLGNRYTLEWKQRKSTKSWWMGGQTGESMRLLTVSHHVAFGTCKA